MLSHLESYKKPNLKCGPKTNKQMIRSHELAVQNVPLSELGSSWTSEPAKGGRKTEIWEW